MFNVPHFQVRRAKCKEGKQNANWSAGVLSIAMRDVYVDCCGRDACAPHYLESQGGKQREDDGVVVLAAAARMHDVLEVRLQGPPGRELRAIAHIQNGF